MKHRFKIYCGPTLVRDLARRLDTSGFKVYLEGVEHVYIETHENIECVLTFLGRQAYSLNDIHELRYTQRSIGVAVGALVLVLLAVGVAMADSTIYSSSDVNGITVEDAVITPTPNATSYDQYRIKILVRNERHVHILVLDSEVCLNKNCNEVYFTGDFPSGKTRWSDAKTFPDYQPGGAATVRITRIQTIAEGT